MICAEYIWLDGATPKALRSKMKVLPSPDHAINLDAFPIWDFDGSSTGQSDGSSSDLLLKPVSYFSDPIRGEGNYLVLCEVFLPDGKTPHQSNTRSYLRNLLDRGASKEDIWIGFEQEYTLFEGSIPLGWPQEGGFPKPQGPFYCGVGSQQVCGRAIAEAHLEACINAQIYIYGINAEVMLGQWEYQVGYRGLEGESPDPLTIADHAWVSRWLLHRVAENFSVHVSFDNKPIKGDWNGAGMHTNFSTSKMRKTGGIQEIEKAIQTLSKHHQKHINCYGEKLAERLTGLHETCNINEFRSGALDRGASVRIPARVAKKGAGYFEDRRPGANSDPYKVASCLIDTICTV